MAEARLERDWDPVRGKDLIVVNDCPHCHQVHYYSTRTPDDPQYGAFGQIVDAKCADNRRRNRADRRYLLVEVSAARERARNIMRQVLRTQMGLRPHEVDVAMNCGLEHLLW